ncbi:MAG: hypothetical protein HOL13_08320 [Phycisphaerae bacterium]|nr:hypothetical protein [Phycisphaerae bacterium]
MLFEHPGWLMVLVLLAPVVWRSRGARVSLGPVRGVVVPVLRCVLIIALVLALAEPVILRSNDDLTVAVVLDRSRSIMPTELDAAVDWVQQATVGRGESDRLAVVHAARDASVVMMPDANGQIGIEVVQGRTDASDLAGGVEYAKGLLPDAGAHRILLVSDGNQTAGSLLEAASRAADAGIPIDVLPIRYERDGEVMLERLIAPSDIRPGDAVDLRVVLRSQDAARGQLTLFRNGVRVPMGQGNTLDVRLEPGLTVVPLRAPASGGAMERYEVTFEPDVSTKDARATNNSASAVSLNAGQGLVLLVSDDGLGLERLAALLRRRGMSVEAGGVDRITGGPTALAAWDAIVLVNLPRWSLPDHVDAELATWVQDGGGGLLMTGGPTAFGAGGWIGSRIAEILPVGLDPPAERQVRRGALAIILHSCEMPRGNYWGRKVAESAIEALSSLDYVGIVEFENRAGGTEWAYPMQVAGDKRGALRAAASLKYGDMPTFASAMRLALNGLDGVEAGQKHVVIISDGDPAPPSAELLDQYVAAKISVSTVMVGGHGTPMDRRRMNVIATATGGRFYDVQNPKQLPGIFIQEAQVVSRSLIQEGAFEAVWSGPGGGPLPAIAMDSIGALPSIRGYVLTEPRGGLARVSMVVPTEQADDPLFAWSHQGLGRVAAFTSDLGNRWTGLWAGWEGEVSLWEHTISWLMRPADDGLLSMTLREGEDGEVVVDVEALDEDAGFLNFLQTQAVVMGPGGVSEPLSLKQSGPGRYRGQFSMADAGENAPVSGGGWVVGVRYRGVHPESGEAVQGWVQDAVIQNWPDEDRAVRSNDSLLAQVAERSGGRVLSMDEDPTLVRIFERTGLKPIAGQRTVWGALAILAAIVLLIDVAVRRIVPDAQRRHVLARRATALADTSVSSASVAWKRVKSRAATRRASRSEPKQVPPPSPSQSNDAKVDKPVDESDDAQSTLSHLRAVRKRLRDQEDEQ